MFFLDTCILASIANEVKIKVTRSLEASTGAHTHMLAVRMKFTATQSTSK